MPLTRKQWIIIGSIGAVLGVALIVGVTVGVVVGRRQPAPLSIQERTLQILTDNPLIDGHNDLPYLIRANFRNNITNLDLYNMTQYTLQASTPSHTDITRLRAGHVGGQFWSIYTSCLHQGKDATVSFMEQIDVMNRIIEKYPDVFQMARTAAEVRQAFQAKRIASLYGVEGGQAIESSFSILRLFYQMGVRYMTLTHNCNNPWADQNQVDLDTFVDVKNGGLTDFGKQVIQEMNRLGMLVDLSHVSKQTMIDVLNFTKSPVIYSHSSAYALCESTRNVHDDVLQLVKQNGGVVMVAFVPAFITCNASYYGTVVELAAHINHIRNVAGIDSVGLGADFDGIDRTLYDLKDTSTYPILIEHLLLQGGWSDEDIIKLIGGNILRVMERNEEIAKELQQTTQPQQGLIAKDQLEKFNLTQCRYLNMYP